MNDGRYDFNSPPPKKRVNNDRRYGLIVILILLAFLIGAIALVTTQSLIGGNPARFVNVPVIQTYLVAEGGGTHMFGTRVVLELDIDAPTISQDMLYSEILAAVSGLSYEEITDPYGMEILREAVRARLSRSFSEEELLGVYFAQFLSDIPLPSLEAERVPGRNPLIDALTGN